MPWPCPEAPCERPSVLTPGCVSCLGTWEEVVLSSLASFLCRRPSPAARKQKLRVKFPVGAAFPWGIRRRVVDFWKVDRKWVPWSVL